MRRQGQGDEQYWIAFVRDPFWVVQDKETHEGETYPKGMRLVGITWAELDSHLAGKPRVYRKLDWHTVISCNYIAWKGTAMLPGGLKYTPKSKMWEMPTDLHERLLQFGDVYDVD